MTTLANPGDSNAIDMSGDMSGEGSGEGSGSNTDDIESKFKRRVILTSSYKACEITGMETRLKLEICSAAQIKYFENP